jgi:branched-chain amino acid aminotransferase
MKENIAFVNDNFVPEERAVVSIFDRGFLYGDGLFATIRVCHGQPFRWRRHLLRLHRGADLLRVTIPQTDDKLREIAIELARQNQVEDGALRITISRGIGARGYSPAGATHPTLTMTIRPVSARVPGQPLSWRCATSKLTLRSDDPLAWFKTSNRLLQVLARGEAEAAGFDEALLLNDEGHVVEATSGNLFWIQEGQICTAPLGTGILPGIARSALFEICESLERRVQECAITRDELFQSEGAFISLSTLGVVEIAQVDDRELKRSPLVPTCHKAYEELVQSETADHGR